MRDPFEVDYLKAEFFGPNEEDTTVVIYDKDPIPYADENDPRID